MKNNQQPQVHYGAINGNEQAAAPAAAAAHVHHCHRDRHHRHDHHAHGHVHPHWTRATHAYRHSASLLCKFKKKNVLKLIIIMT